MSPEDRPTPGTCLCTAHYCHCVVLARRLAEVEAERDRLLSAWMAMGEVCHDWRMDWSGFDGRALLRQWKELDERRRSP